MLALIPYFTVPTLELGPVVLDAWATLVALGFILGLEVARSRGIQKGLDVKDVVDGSVAIVGMGFLVGHIVHVLAYNPHRLSEDGIMSLVRVWEGFSSTGGFIGAVLGAVLFYGLIRKRPFWPHADAIVFGFPFAWVLGRLGCFTAHDHVGSRSDFFLAVDFPTAWYGGPRHDLGLYEALWTMLIATSFFLLRNKPLRSGFFLALFATLYAPARFALDFLRNDDLAGADVRWAGLTPAQWGMAVMFVGGAAVALRLWRLGPEAPLAGAATPAAAPLPDDGTVDLDPPDGDDSAAAGPLDD